jgi:cysteinyl-tRNA synthetase
MIDGRYPTILSFWPQSRGFATRTAIRFNPRLEPSEVAVPILDGEGLQVFNTLSGKLEPFNPISSNHVRIFLCGPTVQNLIHAGHARTDIFYDMVARYLKHKGYEVTLIVNMTDIDESIVEAAHQTGVTPQAYADRYVKAFIEDAAKLGVHSITKFARVSDYIPQIMSLISGLVAKGRAYLDGGDVYFDTTLAPHFGALSHQSPEEMSLRPTELAPSKRSLTDFKLWRSALIDDQAWESPWGVGVPGWHIQDVGVILTELGQQYDIHGGARELIYPHHEALLAQAEGITGVAPSAKYWMHTGLLTVDGKKMSKSEGNMVTVRDLVTKYGPSQLRMYFLSSHYRQDMDFDEYKLDRVDEEFWRLKDRAKLIRDKTSYRAEKGGPYVGLMPLYGALDMDFDTPSALRCVSQLVDEGARATTSTAADSYYGAVLTASRILGVDFFG